MRVHVRVRGPSPSEILAGLDPAPRLPQVPPQDNRTLFIDAMADPSRRRIAFNVVERNCRERFAEGEDGIERCIFSYSVMSGWAT